MAQVDQVEVPTQNGVTMTSLYVGDLDASINEADLFEIFSQMGYVVSVRVCRDLISHLSLGYGYVNFSNPQEASRALNLMNFSTVNAAIRTGFRLSTRKREIIVTGFKSNNWYQSIGEEVRRRSS
ncbi:polyadenylate-binding protein 8-like [Cannabis sativa]|uniref:polyadenylate-binding protein 8-like n=1 Tax=Cannabis sativa TaxID=3483 RepID=UPI0029C9CC76|nr:polyadenylate-binding protein 8-like [Cannabis sativa]